jgi:hypothetical protein
MTFVNTNGMAFIGPGSEWFWSAVSGLILVITFGAIYRQLRIAGSASAYEQLIAFQNEVWSERMVRVDLDLLGALRAGVDPAHVPPGVADILGGFWQQTGALARNGHLDPKLLGTGALGGVTFWWSALAPWIQRIRAENAQPAFMGDFEWLASLVNADRGGRSPGWDRDEVIALLEDRLRIEESLRPSPVVSADRPPSSTSPRRRSQRPSLLTGG